MIPDAMHEAAANKNLSAYFGFISAIVTNGRAGSKLFCVLFHGPAPSRLAGLAQRVQEKTPVVVIMEDVLAPVPPGHHMKIQPGGLNADPAYHALCWRQCTFLSSSCLTPFPA